ncbi:MAG: hypothetical protein BRD52_08030 [Bacteroidetes bacterium SW_4_67_19]|nr:MAG: hypothetical protein BRD52_08030 [Bacteroidetes bacterium SW_4_67_19]
MPGQPAHLGVGARKRSRQGQQAHGPLVARPFRGGGPGFGSPGFGGLGFGGACLPRGGSRVRFGGGAGGGEQDQCRQQSECDRRYTVERMQFLTEPWGIHETDSRIIFRGLSESQKPLFARFARFRLACPFRVATGRVALRSPVRRRRPREYAPAPPRSWRTSLHLRMPGRGGPFPEEQSVSRTDVAGAWCYGFSTRRTCIAGLSCLSSFLDNFFFAGGHLLFGTASRSWNFLIYRESGFRLRWASSPRSSRWACWRRASR